MYSLHLVDGTIIDGLTRINPSTYQFDKDDTPSKYFHLTDGNLCIAFLYDEKDEMVEAFVDYTLQNYVRQIDGSVRFRLCPWQEKYGRKKKWR